MLGGKTRLEGQFVNAAASLAFPMGENIFIVACVGCGGNFLKMVKIRITGETTFVWIEAKYTANYPTNCKAQETFTVECFVGTSVDESQYSVVLVAEPQDTQRKKLDIGKNYIWNKTIFFKRSNHYW